MVEAQQEAVTRDYLSGMSLVRAAQTHGISRHRVGQILDACGVQRRSVAEAHRLAYEELDEDRRRQQTQAARERLAEARAPRGRAAHAVATWCAQKMPLAQRSLAESFKSRGIPVHALYPCGPYNIYLAVPKALLAIEPMPRRLTHRSETASCTKVAHLLRQGYFVTYLGQDPMVHFEAIVALARMRLGAPMDLGQKRQMREAMAPFTQQIRDGHAASIAMATALSQSQSRLGA